MSLRAPFHPAALGLTALVVLAFLAIIAGWVVVVRISSGVPHKALTPAEETRLLQHREGVK